MKMPKACYVVAGGSYFIFAAILNELPFSLLALLISGVFVLLVAAADAE